MRYLLLSSFILTGCYDKEIETLERNSHLLNDRVSTLETSIRLPELLRDCSIVGGNLINTAEDKYPLYMCEIKIGNKYIRLYDFQFSKKTGK